jgi:hypothetical protein
MTVTPTTVPTETTTETPVVTNTPAVSTSPDVTEPAEKEPEVTEIPTIIPTETPTATSTPVPATAITPVPTQTASTVPDQSKRKVQLSGSYKVSKKGIYLTWTKVSGAAYYTVWRFSPNAKTAVKLTSLTGTHFVDKSAEIGKTYRYSITMVTTNRSLYASNLKSIKADPKPVLKKITVKKKKRIVKIKWKYSEVKKVLIYANTGNGYQKIGTVSGKKSLCTIKIPAGYSKVSFRIRGYNTVKKKKYYSKYSKPQKIKL